MTEQTAPAAHILSFAQTLRGGGVERALLRMADGWIRAGRRVTLVIGDPTGALSHELPPGVVVHSIGDARYTAMAALPGIVRDLSPDVIFCPGNHYTAVAWWLRIRLGRSCPPMAAQVSNSLIRPDMPRPLRIGYRAWLRRHPRFLDVIVAMTPAMGVEAVAQMGVAPDRVHVIANPPTRHIADAPPPPMPDGRFILGVGRLAPQKRWDRLIDALPRLRDSSIKLLILGEGEMRASLEDQIRRLGLSDRVMMPGHAPDPLPAMARASVMALTSDFEGVPGVLREAIALGTPVVTTDSSIAIPELIDSPAIGDIVSRDDSTALVAALDHWLTPGTPRPAPRADTGPDPIAAYLALFDSLVVQRSA